MIANIKNMKTQQITNIENGFNSIYSKLEEKKTELIAEFCAKYDKEIDEAKKVETPVLHYEKMLLSIK